jgi:hypothetical protein
MMLLIDIYTDDVLNVWNLQGQDEREIRIRVLRRLPPLLLGPRNGPSLEAPSNHQPTTPQATLLRTL